MANKVVITDCPWEDDSVERKILQASDFTVIRAECKTVGEVIDASREADALLVGWAPVSREVIDNLAHCRVIVRYGIGYDNIDVAAATQAGIAVTNNPDYCVEEVATHALALLMASYRQLSPIMHSVASGGWDPLSVLVPMPRLGDQTVGLVGLGRIGLRFAQIVRPLVARVLVYDPALVTGSVPYNDLDVVGFDELLERSDYISMHCPLTAETRNMFSHYAFGRIRSGAYLINCSRGGVIDELALVEALKLKRIAGAALDVFMEEPLAANSPLRGFDNVIITPHMAWYSAEANFLLRANPAQAIVKFFAGEQIRLLNDPHTTSDAT